MSEAFGQPVETVAVEAPQGEELSLEALVSLWERETRGNTGPDPD